MIDRQKEKGGYLGDESPNVQATHSGIINFAQAVDSGNQNNTTTTRRQPAELVFPASLKEDIVALCMRCHVVMFCTRCMPHEAGVVTCRVWFISATLIEPMAAPIDEALFWFDRGRQVSHVQRPRQSALEKIIEMDNVQVRSWELRMREAWS
ncbi:hypothetical protein BCR44DRAFT_1014241 [Catenaria anguillulae PL171]|uniref:Uncharacterized protein n=1 Tax=Catenaria anguillulae PL171 TaxID=765915 RepID=A0A1Y2HXR2_9FUNG|nr:hypothetical protein BCR44DRAFT_1014241 [Catenaria anguillulae PL171]